MKQHNCKTTFAEGHPLPWTPPKPWSKGTKGGSAPALTQQQVKQIRRFRDDKMSFKVLSAKYGVSTDAVSDAYHGTGGYRGYV